MGPGALTWMAASGTRGPVVGVAEGASVGGRKVLVTVGVTVGGTAVSVAESIESAVR